jgi:hypothetical protein
MNAIRAYNETDTAKAKLLIDMMTCLYQMGSVEKMKCHQSGRVPLKEDAKSWVGVSSCETSGSCKRPSCSICKQVGHSHTQCLMPPLLNRSKVESVSFDSDDLIELQSHKRNKKEMNNMISAEDWIWDSHDKLRYRRLYPSKSRLTITIQSP